MWPSLPGSAGCFASVLRHASLAAFCNFGRDTTPRSRSEHTQVACSLPSSHSCASPLAKAVRAHTAKSQSQL